MRTADIRSQTAVLQHLAVRRIAVWECRDPVAAHVNYGRWVADCSCGGAELVAPDMLFLCGSCGRRCPVSWPDDVQSIGMLLSCRPVEARNWRPDETVHDLVDENGRWG